MHDLSLQMYGARPIRRWVQKNVMTRLSEMLINGEVDQGSIIYVDATEDRKALRYEATKWAGKKKLLPRPQDEMHDSEIATNSDDDGVMEVAHIAGRPCPGHWYHHFLTSLQCFILLGLVFAFNRS